MRRRVHLGIGGCLAALLDGFELRNLFLDRSGFLLKRRDDLRIFGGYLRERISGLFRSSGRLLRSSRIPLIEPARVSNNPAFDRSAGMLCRGSL
jgi:hypothetical protein